MKKKGPFIETNVLSTPTFCGWLALKLLLKALDFILRNMGVTEELHTGRATCKVCILGMTIIASK
jgi:hypothetical protein